jgi:hypothetical protein
MAAELPAAKKVSGPAGDTQPTRYMNGKPFTQNQAKIWDQAVRALDEKAEGERLEKAEGERMHGAFPPTY